MADISVCDICGEQIKDYNGWYRVKYGCVFKLYGAYAGIYDKQLDVCKDCIEQVRELRKAQKGWDT